MAAEESFIGARITEIAEKHADAAHEGLGMEFIDVEVIGKGRVRIDVTGEEPTACIYDPYSGPEDDRARMAEILQDPAAEIVVGVYGN